MREEAERRASVTDSKLVPTLAPKFAPRSSFTGLPALAVAGGGVIATDRVGVGIAVVLARRAKTADLAQRMRERFGFELPLGARCARGPNIGAGVSLSGIRPGGWLATRDHAGNAFATALREALAGLAYVTDQSDGYALLRLSGPKVRDALAKLLPVDLHPRSFQPGDVASTVAAYIATTVWRMDDAEDGTAVFELAVPRSFAVSLAYALHDSAAEFGLCVE